MELNSSLTDINLLQQIVHRSLSAFFIYNLQTGQFDYLNPAFEEIWETTLEQINKNIAALPSNVAKEDIPLVQKSYERLLSNALRQTIEFRIILEENREKWICLTAYSILQQQQRHWLAGFAEDITHTKENEILANKFSSQKNAMLEMLSHDLGGPLGIALHQANQLELDSKQKGEKKTGERAGLIGNILKNSIHMIHSYLEKEYLESSQTAIKKQRIELIEQLQFLLDGFKQMDTERHKQFRLESSSPQVFVEVDQTKFLQIFSNIVSNALKFTHPNGHITIVVEEKAQSVLIRVSDDGIGISKAMLPFIFDRFTKARRVGIQGEETVGLGLSIVKRLVEMHEGKIWVESEENKGSTFFVEIPYQSPD